ncbi:MAG: Gfo/Idh/MocA family oxidoreductase [Bdellovibrio sp.]|nr:Gfo/Idh/MocA family oxidoreductase [Bdellovibrio sp.]
MEQVRVAVIGYGFLGKWHVEKVQKCTDAALMAIVEVSAEMRDRLKVQFPKIKIVANLKDVIDDVDACIIVTPTSYHYSVAKEVLQKGKHVFCEKPMTTTYAEAQELTTLAKQKGIVFHVGHSERFHLIWEQIKKGPYNKSLQGPAWVRIDRAAPFKGRATDVDVVRDLMIHDLDLLLYLFDEWPATVEAIGFKIRTSNYDFVSSVVTFASGKKCFLTAGRNHVEEVRKFDIQGPQGHLQVDMHNCRLKFFGASHTVADVLDYQKRDHLLEEHRSFYQAILGHTPPTVSAVDGARAVYLVDQVLKAVETGHVISLAKL